MVSFPRRGKSRSRGIKTISTYSNSYSNRNCLDIEYLKIKWEIMEYISKYFPLFLHSQDIVPLDFLTYKSNIEVKDTWELCRQIGCSFENMIEINYKNEYLEILKNGNSKYIESNEYIHIVNDLEGDYVKEYPYFDYQIYIESQELLRILHNSIMSKLLISNYELRLISYRNKLNKMKLKRTHYKKILKLNYTFLKELNAFEKSISSSQIYEIKGAFEKYLKEIIIKDREANYKFLTENIPILKVETENLSSQLKNDIKEKLDIMEALYRYRIEQKNKFYNIPTFIITCLTFLVLIYPGFRNSLKICFDTIIKFLN